MSEIISQYRIKIGISLNFERLKRELLFQALKRNKSAML